jgi:serine/threonine protein kinase
MVSYDAGKKLSREQKKQAVFVDFVRSLLTIDPDKRPSAVEVLKHPWMEYAATLTEDDIKYPAT